MEKLNTMDSQLGSMDNLIGSINNHLRSTEGGVPYWKEHPNSTLFFTYPNNQNQLIQVDGVKREEIKLKKGSYVRILSQGLI